MLNNLDHYVRAAKVASGPSTAKAREADGSSSSSGGASNGTDITSNDFLQLLVAEMQNQDPTADQDPNEYIDQLVQVNSLQQLIQINQDLGGGSSNSSNNTQAVGAAQPRHAANPAERVATALAPSPTAAAQPRALSNGDPETGSVPQLNPLILAPQH